MTMENFLSFLQQLITMTDPDDRASVGLAKTALTAAVELAVSSRKINSLTWRVMKTAEAEFERLLRHKDSFQGMPGDYQGNEIKRHRLLDVLRPGC